MAGALVALAAYRRATRPVLLASPGRDGDLAGRRAILLDPNAATEAELEALPGIGPGRAQNIVEYREARHDEAGVAFRSAEDLRRVKNLPDAVIDDVAPHLRFPEERR